MLSCCVPSARRPGCNAELKKRARGQEPRPDTRRELVLGTVPAAVCLSSQSWYWPSPARLLCRAVGFHSRVSPVTQKLPCPPLLGDRLGSQFMSASDFWQRLGLQSVAIWSPSRHPSKGWADGQSSHSCFAGEECKGSVATLILVTVLAVWNRSVHFLE